MHFLRGILNLWKIRGKCDSADHKAGRWEEEVFIKLTARKAAQASDTECSEERMPCCLGQSDVRRNICDQLEAGTLRNATALSQAKPTDSASFITGPRRWGQLYLYHRSFAFPFPDSLSRPAKRFNGPRGSEAASQARHRPLQRAAQARSEKRKNIIRLLAKCRYKFLWCVNLLTRHQSKSFYDN